MCTFVCMLCRMNVRFELNAPDVRICLKFILQIFRHASEITRMKLMDHTSPPRRCRGIYRDHRWIWCKKKRWEYCTADIHFQAQQSPPSLSLWSFSSTCIIPAAIFFNGCFGTAACICAASGIEDSMEAMRSWRARSKTAGGKGNLW